MSVEADADFVWTEQSWGRGLRSTALGAIAPHVFTTRDLALTSDEGEWSRVAEALDARRLVRLRQVHGSRIVHVRRGEQPPTGTHGARLEADILISDDPTAAIAVQGADCVPLLLADPATGAVAAAHAGWRGMAARVPHHAVAALSGRFDAHPASLVAAVGPSIGACCYEVGPELPAIFARERFDDGMLQRWFRSLDSRPGRLVFDLWTAVRDQLVAAGLDPANVHIAGLCTATHADLFPSYRRDGAMAGRIAGAIRAATR
jgi:purine-nucleoside/S-methyl-5'-thioadenosine phosphorylase / adenosine deaminase